MFTFLNAFEAPVFYKHHTLSTMEDARMLISSGCPHGTVTAAGHQEAGKGRLTGRRWEAEEGKNLLLSIVLKKEFLSSRWTFLPLAAGLAVCEALENLYGISSRIKWPNDVWWRKKKISGILCEGVGAFIIAGIGINCNQAVFPDEIADRAVSVAGITGRPVEVPALGEELIARLKSLIQSDNVTALVEDRLLFRGEQVTVATGFQDHTGTITGVCRGIGEEGELILLDPDTGEETGIFGGELVVF